MHFLIGIVTADGVLTNDESIWLRKLAVQIELNIRTFDAILAMFRFRNEYERQKEQPARRTSSQMLDSAYKILEIEKTVSDQEVKKAYRKLAVLHHPDKVSHLGTEFQKTANEKFQIIVAAYELIQKQRKFV
jgi:DnaJ like chaperone protein